MWMFHQANSLTKYILMKKYSWSFVAAIALLVLVGCKKEGTSLDGSSIKEVVLKVSFQGNKSASGLKAGVTLTKETPASYYIGLKAVRLIGTNGTADAELFNQPKLSSSMVFDFKDNSAVHSLFNGTTIPKGDYSSIEFDIYFLQMNIAISTTKNGIEHRNVRIYLSDDADTEGGPHQPGDLTQIIDSQEVGWITWSNFEPVVPRSAKYSIDGNGVNWLNFGGKSGKDFGPFGSPEFFNAITHPIYKTKAAFILADGKGSRLVVDFNVNGCWQFEDKNGDGVFGYQDLDPVNLTAWHMALPVITVTQN